jgi:hypothetical protein
MHNALPERSGAPLKHSSSLCRAALSYATYLASRNSGLVHGHDGSSDGENLAYFGSSNRLKMSAASVVKAWYNEKYTESGLNHYTQVVWRGSTHMCMVAEQANDGTWYTVARYSPAGNIIGRQSSNVLTKGGKVSCGSHSANSCAGCPQGHGKAWCHGMCTWDAIGAYNDLKPHCM